MHLTLLFLGEIDAACQIKIEEILRETARNFPSFVVEISGIGRFPCSKSPKVVWVGISETPTLMALQKTLTDKISRKGFPVEKSRFHPQLTLGGIRGRVSDGLLCDWIREDETVKIGSVK